MIFLINIVIVIIKYTAIYNMNDFYRDRENFHVSICPYIKYLSNDFTFTTVKQLII